MPAKRAAKHRARRPASERTWWSALAEVARAFLQRDRSTPSLLYFIGRLASYCLGILTPIIIIGGGEGALVATQLVYLIALLVVVAAIDQWFAAPRARKVDESLNTPRPEPAKSSPKPPPQAQSNQPP